MYYNQVNYQTENYSDKVLDRHMYDRAWPVKSTDNRIQTMYIRQSYLESEERYLGDGFFPRQADWFEMIEGEKYNDGWEPESIMNFAFTMSLDTKQYNRSVYSILDFLGDVGGLLSILLPIGGALIALLDELFKRTLDSYIIERVFPNKR